MSDATHAACRRCGAPIPPDDPAGLCPRCGLDSATNLVTGRQAGPTLESLAAGIGPLPLILLPDTADGATEQPLVDPSSTEMPPFAVRPVRVQLLGEIARGGMGVVLKGRDPDLGRDVAVKVLLESNKENSDLVRRFVEEAQIGGQLQHPGVVPVYELGTFGDSRPYFTMKLVKGRTLAELLGDRDAATDDLPRFLGIFEQVCQTMAYAHSRDVIHRDLKPSNVMVGSFGEVQVMDWGLAKVLPKGGVIDDAAAGKVKTQQTVIATARVLSDSDLSQAGSVMGTPAYMAPEQARGEGEVIDRRADVFALGSILCEVLTGQPAFVGRKPGEIHRKAALGDLVEAMTRLEACGAEGELIFLARDCLAREPEDRPPHAAAVTDRITGYFTGVQVKLRAAEIARATEQTRAEEEAKRRVLADELAREAEARALESQRTALAAEGRAKAERQARRMTAALAASVLGLAVVSGSGYAWFRSQRAERQSRVDLALREAEVLRVQAAQAGDDLARWDKAGDAAHAVEQLMADARDEATRRRVAVLVQTVATAGAAAVADRKLLDDLIDVRSAKADDRWGPATDESYASAFRDAGLDVTMAPDQFNAKIRARPAAVAATLAAALDDWAAVRRNLRRDRPGAERLAQAARAADPDPWRNSLRAALDIPDKSIRLQSLQSLARDAKAAELAPISLDLLGSALLDAGDPQAAERVLRQAQRRYPGDVWLNYNLARCLEKLSRREEAIRYYTSARSIRPETAHELAEALERRGEADEAVAVFRDLERLQPKNGRHLGCLARALIAQGRTKEAAQVLVPAVAMLKGMIQTRPGEPPLHFQLGFALEQQGKLDEALAELRIALRLRPDDVSTVQHICDILNNKGKFEEAIAMARDLIRINPDATVHHVLGNSLQALGKLDDAIAEYRTAVRMEPESHYNHEYLGRALAQHGNVDEAIAEYRAAIQIDPTCFNVRDSLGSALQGQGKLEEAIGAYKEAIRLKPTDGYAHTMLGDVLSAQGKLDEAIAAYKEAIRLDPAGPRAHNMLGNALSTQGKMSEAMVEYRNGLRLESGVAYAHNEFAWLVALSPDRTRRDYDEALEHSRKAVELAPEEGFYVNTLALAEYRVSHWNESIAAGKRSMALRKGGRASDWFFLAMAHSRKGEKDQARKWFDKAIAWTREKDPKNVELIQFWNEAAKLLALPGPSQPDER